MITEKRSQAARANGARSRGPVTPEGKAISARNALSHGLLASTVVLSTENADFFEQSFYLLIQRFNPADDVEMSAIEEMAAAQWRGRRAIAMEHAILEAGIAGQPIGSPIQQTAGAFCDAAANGSLALLHRYETRLQNVYLRALRGLALLRKLPRQTAPPPEAPETPEAPERIAPVPNEPRTPNRTPNACTTENACTMDNVCTTENVGTTENAPPGPLTLSALNRRGLHVRERHSGRYGTSPTSATTAVVAASQAEERLNGNSQRCPRMSNGIANQPERRSLNPVGTRDSHGVCL